MFVAVNCDTAGEDSKAKLSRILIFYGFKEKQKDLYESMTVKETTLKKLKRDVDRATDYYDKVTFYQYPLEEHFVVTELVQKRWRRKIFI